MQVTDRTDALGEQDGFDEMTVIEFPATGKTYSHDCYGVYTYDTYPAGSVLEGQERRRARGEFETEAEARGAFPNAKFAGGSGYVDRPIPVMPPRWLDPANAGESWDGE